MKVFTILGLVAALMTQAPRKVLNAFEFRFRGADRISWAFADDYYQVSFEHFGQKKQALFRYNGEWINTFVTLEPSELMFCIRDYIKYKYTDASIWRAYYVITPEICEYYVYLKRKEGEEECFEEEPLVFDENCEFLRNPN